MLLFAIIRNKKATVEHVTGFICSINHRKFNPNIKPCKQGRVGTCHLNQITQCRCLSVGSAQWLQSFAHVFYFGLTLMRKICVFTLSINETE